MKLPNIICPACAHQWVPRVPQPVRCPRCQKLEAAA